jgi:Mce-associated membrane protein
VIEHQDGDIDETNTRTSGPSPRLTRWVAAFLAVLCLVALVVVVVEFAALRPKYNDVRAEQQNRTDVVRVAQQFTAEVNNYGVDSIDQYQEHITPLLTTKFQGEFKKAMTDIVASVKQAKMTSKGDVLASAVSSVDPDSAQVLVVADANVKTVFDTRARHFRWEVSLVKVDGKWLVDNFEPIA